MPNECQSPKPTVRQTHHDFILQHFQTVILSLSKDELWIWFDPALAGSFDILHCLS